MDVIGPVHRLQVLDCIAPFLERLTDGLTLEQLGIKTLSKLLRGLITYRPIGSQVIGYSSSQKGFSQTYSALYTLWNGQFVFLFFCPAANASSLAGVEEDEAGKVSQSYQVRAAQDLPIMTKDTAALRADRIEERMTRIVNDVVLA